MFEIILDIIKKNDIKEIKVSSIKVSEVVYKLLEKEGRKQMLECCYPIPTSRITIFGVLIKCDENLNGFEHKVYQVVKKEEEIVNDMCYTQRDYQNRH